MNFIFFVVLTSCLEMTYVIGGVIKETSIGFDELARINDGILSGHPRLAAFQNRLLGAALQRVLELLHLPANYAFTAAIIGLILGLNLLYLLLSRGLPQDWRVKFFLAFSLLWLALIDIEHVFLWDFIDLAIFATVALVMGGCLSEKVLWPVFAVAVLNRESSAFIGLWLLIGGAAQRAIDWRRVATGLGMIAATALYTVAVRRALLISSPKPGDVAGGTFIALRQNLDAIGDLLHWPMRVPLLAALLMIVGWLAVRVVLGRFRDDLALYLLVAFGLTCMFGFWFETRVFLFLAPSLALILVGSPAGPSRGDPRLHRAALV